MKAILKHQNHKRNASMLQTFGKEIVQVHFVFDGYHSGYFGDWIVPWGLFIRPPHTAAINAQMCLLSIRLSLRKLNSHQVCLKLCCIQDFSRIVILFRPVFFGKSASSHIVRLRKNKTENYFNLVCARRDCTFCLTFVNCFESLSCGCLTGRIPYPQPTSGGPYRGRHFPATVSSNQRRRSWVAIPDFHELVPAFTRPPSETKGGKVQRDSLAWCYRDAPFTEFKPVTFRKTRWYQSTRVILECSSTFWTEKEE